MKNAIIRLLEFLLILFGSLAVIMLGYVISPYGGLIASVALIILAGVGFFWPYVLVRNRKNAAAIIALALLGCVAFSGIKTKYDARVLESLKISDSKSYLDQLRAGGDQALYLKELKRIDPKQYEIEEDKRATAKAAAIREEHERLKIAAENASSLTAAEQMVLYSRLKEIDPSNPTYEINYRAARQLNDRIEAVRDAQFHPKKYITLTDINWAKEGFGIVVIASFTLKNTSQIDFKDIMIKCEFYAASGTMIDQSHKTVYEIIKSNKTKRIKGFNLGFINNQVRSGRCDVTSATAV